MDPFIHQLNSRLERTGADAVNSYIDDNFEKMVPRLRELVRRCDPDALALTIKLLNSTNASATQGNAAMLEIAMGRCPERLLPMVPTTRVKGLCAVEAFADNQPGGANPAQLIREIDRRTRSLRSRGAVANSEKGKICLEGYEEVRRDLANSISE
ncbi:hypothetical protein [Mitsuaria sp. 7]|uniref:hypothetical protein n=1 Tax=Mitsuaria sp. 7 TaxID=1658665 RepID=UPI0012FA1B73|nr:hypothetical protein [Mitsuaria sp. 7]